MRVRRLPTALAAVVAMTALASLAPGASASTVLGSTCAADSGTTPASTVVPIENGSSNPLPLTAPFTGIATGWRIDSAIPFSEPHLVLAMRQLAEDEFETRAQGPLELVKQGLNVFELRMPVEAGERFGAWGPKSTFVCIGTAGDPRIAFTTDLLTPFTKAVFAPSSESIEGAVAVTIEPDADRDGFGDETQDGCPQSARHSSTCPVIALDSHALASRRSVLVLISASETAPVTITASATIPHKPGKARASARVRLNPVTVTAADGKLARARLRFKRRLMTTLDALPRRRSVKLSVRLTGTDLAGRVSTDTATVKLRGRR